MNSIFGASAFGYRGIPGYSMGTVRLAQTETPSDPDVSGLKSGIDGLLKQLPAEVLGKYDAQYKECLAKLENGGAVGLAAGVKCLRDLYNEIQAFMKNGPPKPAAAPAPAASDFPLVPVLVGGIGLIVLIWGLSKL